MKKTKNALAGIGFGIILFIVCTILLFKNEGRAVDRYKALGEISQGIEISSDDTTIEDGSMIILADVVKGQKVIIDEEIGVTAPEDAIKLIREVTMYQWKEHSSSDDSYTYEKIWSDSKIDSSKFNDLSYVNPTGMAYESTTLITEEVTCGAYSIDSVFVNKMRDGEALTTLEDIKQSPNISTFENQVFMSSNGNSTLQQPEIGDYLITYNYVASKVYTLLGEKSGERLISYYTKYGNLAEVEVGQLSKEGLEDKKVQDNKSTTFGFRIALIIGVIIANGLVLSPLTKLLDHIPLLGRLVSGGIKLVSSLLGIIWSILVIAVGWIFYRPILGIGLLAIGAGLAYVLIKKNKEEVQPIKKEEAQPIQG